MLHCEPTSLALVALGEPIEPEDAAHLESCEQCMADAAELVEVVTIGREAPAELPEVPEHVWAGIRAELGLLAAPDGALAPVLAIPAARPAAVEPQPSPQLAEVVPMRPRRARLFTVGAVAAAAGALVGGAVVWAALDSAEGGPAEPGEQVVAQAILSPLVDDVSQSGQAQVLQGADGQAIRVDARALPQRDGFYEVWLLDPSDASQLKLLALGALPAGSVGTFTVPPGVSIEDYPGVDISLEPLDGDPAHSSESLMRGTLDA
jgi:hypothetical protein